MRVVLSTAKDLRLPALGKPAFTNPPQDRPLGPTKSVFDRYRALRMTRGDWVALPSPIVVLRTQTQRRLLILDAQ